MDRDRATRFSILGELLTAAALALTQNPSLYYGTFASLNAFAVAALVLDLSLSGVYLYKLLVFDLDGCCGRTFGSGTVLCGQRFRYLLTLQAQGYGPREPR
jgi:hypothetical protein